MGVRGGLIGGGIGVLYLVVSQTIFYGSFLDKPLDWILDVLLAVGSDSYLMGLLVPIVLIVGIGFLAGFFIENRFLD